MIKAVLLDLDNTLLRNPDHEFAKAFLDLFEQHFRNANYDAPSQKLHSAIQAMGHEQTGQYTNQQVLIHQLGGTSSETIALIDQFYAEVFPQLQSCIGSMNGASDLIYRLREMDLAVVIATNPIYPHRAIEARMRWANLPLDEDLYALVTSADNMHFAKPDPAYYAEILARVGVEPDEAIMVGDSLRNDIQPASQVGLHTCHIRETNLAHFSDNMADYFEQTIPLQLQAAMIEPQLRGNIGALFALLDLVEAHYWHQRPDPNEWSIIQILCHLLTFEDQNERLRLQTILQEDNPFITQPPEPGPDIEACETNGFAVAQAFMATRQQTIDLIDTFSADDWQRRARHSIFGLTTMLEMAYFTAQHDRLHLTQLCQTIGRCD
ncbi:MAG: HAD-IA family hydrolase [Chloroflexota bacterium]